MAETKITDEVVGDSAEVVREQALRRLKKRRDFHSHLFAYLTVNVVLWGVWAFFSARSHSWNPWPLWVTLGWGVALILNAWDVYGRRPITEGDIQREMDRLTHRSEAP
jgi:fatty acid desaturase